MPTLNLCQQLHILLTATPMNTATPMPPLNLCHYLNLLLIAKPMPTANPITNS